MRYLRVGLTAALVTFVVLSPAPSAAHEGAHGEGGQLGISVQSVVEGGAAEAAGLLPGDRFVAFDGKEVGELQDLQGVLDGYRPGDTVPLVVERDGEVVELVLTFAADREGAISMGVSLAIGGLRSGLGGADPLDEGLRRAECLTWIDETYRVEALIGELGLDLTEDWETARVCAAGDVERMVEPIPTGWCDNVFKIHCSGVDLLTEIGEAQIERCEELLGGTAAQDPAWKRCGAQEVFDRYTRDGRASDATACQAVLEACRESR